MPTADQIIDELRERGYELTNEEGFANTYAEALVGGGAAQIALAPARRLVLAHKYQAQLPAGSRLGSLYVHTLTTEALREHRDAGVIVATGRHAQLLSGLQRGSGRTVRGGHEAWRGRAAGELLVQLPWRPDALLMDPHVTRLPSIRASAPSFTF
jgi:hypothetical protein